MKLSKQQEAIVNATASKIVVIASAAAGKTAVLTARIQHLLDSGVDPHKIVAITFTNERSAQGLCFQDHGQE